MDTTRDIIYRDYLVNDEDIEESITGGGAVGTGIAGCVVDSFDLSDVDVVQFMEKRSQADGMDVGDAAFGSRRIRLAGTLYGKTRALLFDSLFDLRAAFNAVLAQRESPADKGYRPLYFSVPTNRIADYPTGAIALQMFAMPRAFQQVSNRDQIGGDDADALALPWQATLICKDPGIYSADPVDVAFTATSSVSSGVSISAATNLVTKVAHGLAAGNRVTFSSLTGGTGLSTGVAYYVLAAGLTSSAFALSLTSGGAAIDVTVNYTAATYVKSSVSASDWSNRGSYLGTVNMVIEVGAGAGSIVATVGDSAFTITIPASTVNRIIRVKGQDKIITLEESDVETTRMDLIAFTGDTTWPLIDPGDTPYSITFHGMSGVVTGSHMYFYEQYA